MILLTISTRNILEHSLLFKKNLVMRDRVGRKQVVRIILEPVNDS